MCKTLHSVYYFWDLFMLLCEGIVCSLGVFHCVAVSPFVHSFSYWWLPRCFLVFLLVAIMNNTAMNFLVQGIFCKHVFLFLLNKYLSRIAGSYIKTDNSLYHCTFPPSTRESSCCSTLSPIVSVVDPFHFSWSSEYVIVFSLWFYSAFLYWLMILNTFLCDYWSFAYFLF